MSTLNFSFGNYPDANNPFESDVIVEQNADAADSLESATEDLPVEGSAIVPNDEQPGNPSDEPIAKSEQGDAGDKPGDAAAEGADAPADNPENPEETTEDDTTAGDDETAAASVEPTIPTGDEFRETHRREMPKKIAEEVARFLDEGRAAQVEANQLRSEISERDTLIESLGGQEILTEYQTIHEFLTQLPPSDDDTEGQMNYLTSADRVWEGLTQQNETAAVQLAITGGLQFVQHVPESRNTFLQAMFGDDLKLKTEAKGDNSQEDIENYSIDAARILGLIRLDAFGFLPADLNEYSEDFSVREGDALEAAKAAAKTADPDEQSKTPTGDQPAASQSFAEFEKEFEEALPNRIETALQKGNFQANPAVKKLIGLAVETIVRKSDDYKTVSEYLKAGNKYKDGEKVSQPIKMHNKKLGNSVSLQAEALVKELIDSLGNLPKVEPEIKLPALPPKQPEQNREEHRAPSTPTDGGNVRYSSEYVAREKARLNGGLA